MRRPVKSCVTILAAVAATLLLVRETLAANRVAVIVGNGAYQKVPQLNNPSHDADDVAASFERLGFTVHKLIDARYDDMRRALLTLGREARNADMAVLYFSGHGIEIGGQNWLIPVDAELRADTDVENEAISLNSVMLQVSTARKLGLVILDACRNNPFAAKMAFSTRTRAVARGLARTEPNENVLVAFAAKDGTVANDGNGRNSPFTEALLKNLEQPGIEITFMFRNIRDAVMAATRREQQPFVYGSLSREAIYLAGPPPAAMPAVPPAAALPAPDDLLWATIRDSRAPGLYEEFLRRFPSSRHAAAARARLDELRKLALAAPARSDARTLSPPPADDTGATQADGLFTAKDAERVADVIRRLKMVLPRYRFLRPDDTVPEAFRRFVGVWASRVGFAGGRGRQLTLFITDVDARGHARGHYAFGPPTRFSPPAPADTWEFSGTIAGDELTYELRIGRGRAKLTPSGVLVPRQHLNRNQRTPMIQLEPVWRLSERAAKK